MERNIYFLGECFIHTHLRIHVALALLMFDLEKSFMA